MRPAHKKVLKNIVLEIRHVLEGWYDSRRHAGDVEQRLAAIGVRLDRNPIPVDELPQLSEFDRKARRVTDAYIALRKSAGMSIEAAVSEYVRETAYTWANRLLALRCMEARELIDEVILQKGVYGGRSLEHHRFALRHPEACVGEDDGLYAVLLRIFGERSKSLPLLFDPLAPGLALRPSVAALKRCIRLLSTNDRAEAGEAETAEVFKAPDALGWAYQFYQEEEKKRVDEWLKGRKGFKCEGADIIPKTSLYTESYIVRFLVQNSLGATWVCMHPDSRLPDHWPYFVRQADRAPALPKAVSEITFLDPACGSGHFLLEAFDLFYGMYEEEGKLSRPDEICRSILSNNLFGIDIDERCVQIAETVLWMKAAERAPDFQGCPANLLATNIRLPKGKDHLKAFLKKHPDDAPLRPALETAFEGLEHVDEIGSLLRIEEPVQKELAHLQKSYPLLHPAEDNGAWREEVVTRLARHFHEEYESADTGQGFFSSSAGKGFALFELFSRRYDVVATNPPYMGSKSMGPVLKKYVEAHYKPGKRDLYAAFILRCLELAAAGGRVGMVTQQSWMFLRSYAELRAVDEDKAKELGKGAFKGVLRDTSIETLAHLGPGAFSEISGEVVNIALFTLAKREPTPEHRLTAFRLIGPKSPEQKDRLLRQALQVGTAGVAAREETIRTGGNESRNESSSFAGGIWK